MIVRSPLSGSRNINWHSSLNDSFQTQVYLRVYGGRDLGLRGGICVGLAVIQVSTILCQSIANICWNCSKQHSPQSGVQVWPVSTRSSTSSLAKRGCDAPRKFNCLELRIDNAHANQCESCTTSMSTNLHGNESMIVERRENCAKVRRRGW